MHQFRATFCTCRPLSNSWLHRYGCEWMWRLPENVHKSPVFWFLWGLVKPRRPWGQKDWFAKKGDKAVAWQNPLCCPLLLCWCEMHKAPPWHSLGNSNQTNSRMEFHDVNKKNSARNVLGLIWGTCHASVWILTRQLLFYLDIQHPRAAQTIQSEIQDGAERKSNITTEKNLPLMFPLHISVFGYLLANLCSSAQLALAVPPTQPLIPCFPPGIQPALHGPPGSCKERISSVEKPAPPKLKQNLQLFSNKKLENGSFKALKCHA